MNINRYNEVGKIVNSQRNIIHTLNTFLHPATNSYSSYLNELNNQRLQLVDESTRTSKNARTRIYWRIVAWAIVALLGTIIFAGGLYVNNLDYFINLWGNLWRSTSTLIFVFGLIIVSVSSTILIVNIFKIGYYRKLSTDFFGKIVHNFLNDRGALTLKYHGIIAGKNAKSYKVVENKNILVDNVNYYFFSDPRTKTLVFIDNFTLMKFYIFQAAPTNKNLVGTLKDGVDIFGIDEDYKRKMIVNYANKILKKGNVLEFDLDLSKNHSFIKITKKDYSCSIKALLFLNLFLIL